MHISNLKRGQISFFIIIIVLVVASILIFFLFRDKISVIFGRQTPLINFKSCVEKDIKEITKIIGEQGGSLEPAHFTYFKGKKVEYLCYTNLYYKTCINQQPMLKNYVESQLNSYIQPRLKKCADSYVEEMRDEGYTVSGNSVEGSVELRMNTIRVNIKSNIILSREDEVIKLSSASFDIKNYLYNFIMFTNAILNWEAQLGDSETTLFMVYYPNMKVEKFLQGDGTKIYTLTNRLTNEKFIFASRSLSMPPGYGTLRYIKS